MFPDAVTARGRRHLLELAALAKGGQRSAVLFLVHYPHVDYFLPDYHTDHAFAEALLSVRKRVLIKAVSVAWQDDLALDERSIKALKIPWALVEQESRDCGNYIIILQLKHGGSIGGLGEVLFRQGYYLYVGSARRHLQARINRHVRRLKNHFWHIDYLREHADIVATVPFRGTLTRECDIAQSVARMADWQVEGFGSSDCVCAAHLFGLRRNPLASDDFIKLMLGYRIGVLHDALQCPRGKRPEAGHRSGAV